MLAAEPKWFSFTVKILIGPEMVLGYFIFKNKSGYGLRLFFCPSIFLKNKRPAKTIKYTQENFGEIILKLIYACEMYLCQ